MPEHNAKLTRICSYCDRVMSDAGPGAMETHGICPPCMVRQEAKLSIMRSIKTVRWTLCPVCKTSIRHPGYACWSGAGFVHLGCLTTKQLEKAGLFQIPALPEEYSRCEDPDCGWCGKASDRYPVHPDDSDSTQCPDCGADTVQCDENGDEL